MTLRKFSHAMLTLLVSSQLILFGGPVHAGTFGTGDYLAADDREVRIERVRDFLAEDRVRDQLEQLGVDAEAAEGRVAALTNEELAMLDARIDEMPAGSGVLGIVGAVFVVLLVLELVGVTNIFNAI